VRRAAVQRREHRLPRCAAARGARDNGEQRGRLGERFERKRVEVERRNRREREAVEQREVDATLRAPAPTEIHRPRCKGRGSTAVMQRPWCNGRDATAVVQRPWCNGRGATAEVQSGPVLQQEVPAPLQEGGRAGRLPALAVPPPPLVLSGHAASLTPY
jgi:hypothetical protein